MPFELKGILSPVLTPISDDGSLATDRVEESVRFSLDCGCHAVVAAGTGSQETASLTPEERKTLVEETVRAVDGEVPVLAGVSHPAQPVANNLVAHAEDVGADAVIAMPPWGDVPSASAIVRYYEAIASESSLPVAVYNNPTLTVDMSKDTMRRVANIDGVTDMKESRRNWQKIAWLLDEIQRSGLARMHTTMDVLWPTIQAGGSGAFVPAPASAPAMEVFEALQRGDTDTAIEHSRTFTKFPPEAASGLIPACKAAAQACGVAVGSPRPPFDGISEAGREAVIEWLDGKDIPGFDR